jgi:hypothetical protein
MMTPFRLYRRSEPEPAMALLLLSHRPEEVLRLCGSLPCLSWPPVYAVAEGFLVKLPGPSTRPFAGVIRLRELSANLLLPVDAELVPPLLPDEASALVRQRGLVFLPGNRVLEFHPDEALPVAALLGADQVLRNPWQPLPEPPPLADRLTEITLDVPEVSPDDLLEAGGEGIGTEQPRPPDAGLPSRVAGNVAYGIGRGIAWLGSLLHLRPLARAGANLMAGGLYLVPRLSESLLGRQEAALRELLRDFRAGNVEQALRRALPIGGDTPRGAVPAGDARLPFHNLWYSLRNLLGAAGGPASIWYNRDETYRELETEYRRQAEAALGKGDYRRAAFIYARLLGDYRLAAAALARGGLHHDAAVLYLAKLSDRWAAAREFEAAGEIDRALELYRQRGEHELAGDLLRRVGEEDRAIAEYQLAAAKLLAAGQGPYRAAEMLLSRARRPDLALPLYRAGWAERPAANCTACALRLAQSFAREGAVEPLLQLVTEGEQFLGGPGNEGPAAEFFNEVARVANEPGLAGVRDELRDRARLGLAGKIRQRVEAGSRSGTLVSTMLGQSGLWAAPVVSDAQFAVTGQLRQPPRPPGKPSLTRVEIPARIRVVTAAGWAPETGDIFLGFQSGEVVCYRPQTDEVVFLPVDLPRNRVPVTSLAISADGNALAVFKTEGDTVGHLSSLTKTGTGYRILASRDVPGGVANRLYSKLGSFDGCVAATWNSAADQVLKGGMRNKGAVQILKGTQLLPGGWLEFPGGKFDGEGPPETVLLLAPFHRQASADAVIVCAGNLVWYHYTYECVPSFKPVGWSPCLPPRSTLTCPPLSWLRKGPEGLALAGIGSQGTCLYRTDLEFRGGKLDEVTTHHHSCPEGYLAVTILRNRLVAAVTPAAVQLLQFGADGFSPQKTFAIAIPKAVACFPWHRNNELLVVSGDGTVSRISL